MLKILLAVAVAAATFIWGVATVRYQVFPFELMRSLGRSSGLSVGQGDELSNAANLFYLSVRDVDVVFVGDSLTRHADWQDMFPEVAVANRGIGSDTLPGITRRVDTIVSTQAERVFLMAGINDLIGGRSPDAVFADYITLVEQLERHGLQVVIQSTVDCTGACTKHPEITELNRLLSVWAAAKGIQYIDLNAVLSVPGGSGLRREYTVDGIHLSAEGYAAWADVIRSEIRLD